VKVTSVGLCAATWFFIGLMLIVMACVPGGGIISECKWFEGEGQRYEQCRYYPGINITEFRKYKERQ